MIKISKNMKVFVIIPATVVAGGAELLHQLVHVLNNNGFKGYIVYYDGFSSIPKEYEKYNLKLADIIEDISENIVVIHEGVFNKIYDVKNAQIITWWLSVDNFFYCAKRYLSLIEYFKWKPTYGILIFLFRMKKLLIDRENYFRDSVSFKDLKRIPALNCYQSEYAQNFLLNNGFSEILPLSDFINTELISKNSNSIKENIILYNPKKGLKYTKKLMRLAPNLNWIPLKNMNRKQLQEIFQKSKLYIDFGYHPGKDRLPREAAINKCCVITNTQGSARFYEDVAVYDEYKFDITKIAPQVIIKKIEEILSNYDSHIDNFSFYRKQIMEEERLFSDQVLRIFANNETV